MLDHLYFYLLLGLFRERKRSKSKTKIDSRSLKLQETIAPSQIAMSNFSVTNEGGMHHCPDHDLQLPVNIQTKQTNNLAVVIYAKCKNMGKNIYPMENSCPLA